MSPLVILLLLVSSTTAHFVMTGVLALYARHQVKYLCLAWVNGIFSFLLLTCCFYSLQIATGHPGILHPMMLVGLMTGCFLQSIYPLSIPMPGFLQWKQMWQYAFPALLVIGGYALTFLAGWRIEKVDSFTLLFEQISSFDILLRLVSLGISIYYIINILRLPHHLLRQAHVPKYMTAYTTLLGLSVIYYTIVTIFYSPLGLLLYLVIFTLLNLYLAYRTLETMALSLPKPVIEEVKEEPTAEVIEKADREDFNEANLQRFHRIQFWMQHHPDLWKDSSFGRDVLCEEVGYNRHLVLQCVRSQGFNNVHDYITSFRINELKRMVRLGQISAIGQTVDAGFGSIKTARACFLKHEGITLDEFLDTQPHKSRR